MTITCPKCQAQYRYDDSRFGDAPRKRVKCPKCSGVFEVDNPATSSARAAAVAQSGTAAPAGAPEPNGLPQLAPIPRDLRLSLAVIAGPQAGTVFPVSKSRVYIGRGSGMDVQLKDGEVSRRHAMLELQGTDVTLSDLSTTNGTFVDGRRVQKAQIPNQGEFTIGSTTLMLILTDTPESGG